MLRLPDLKGRQSFYYLLLSSIANSLICSCASFSVWCIERMTGAVDQFKKDNMK